MATQMVIEADRLNTATTKLDQAAKLAEMLGHYEDVNEECQALRKSAAFVIMDLLTAAQGELEHAKA